MTVSVEMTVGQQPQALVLNTGAVREHGHPQRPGHLRLVDGKAARTALTLGLRGTGADRSEDRPGRR
jgi:hypothetical protein